MEKALKVIASCKSRDQFDCAVRYVRLYENGHGYTPKLRNELARKAYELSGQ